MFVDTHCHIHESTYPLDREAALERAHTAGVEKMICVGTDQVSSREAVEFAMKHAGIFAAVGVHPHEAKDGWDEITTLLSRSQSSSGQSRDGFAGAVDTHSTSQKEVGSSTARRSDKIVAVGEIGLDYFYTHSPREVQIVALEAQIDMALRADLPIIFHVREAFDDFWPIFDNFHGIRGELHSFTDTTAQLEQGLKRGLYIGVNGISTFTKDDAQRAMFAAVPPERMLLETDAPFLTPTPLRGKVNEPAFVRHVAEFHAVQRGMQIDELAAVTTKNASLLFEL
jgi:TatD DNase family protein